LRPHGCDCIFFFNYNRINAALSNPEMKTNMDLFFGQAKANTLRLALAGKTPLERQELIITELKRALKEMGGAYTVEYYFKNPTGQRTSHFLILTSKNALAERKMKEIMAQESTKDAHGFASFGYDPLAGSHDDNVQPSLFELNAESPVETLAKELLSHFAGHKLTVESVYKQHSIGRRYTLRNYKDAIKKLDAEKRVLTDPPKERRRRAGTVTLGEGVFISFPAKED
jgi:hypothetical protein